MKDDAKPGAARIDRELDDALDDLEALLKNGDAVAALTARGVNASLALCALSGLRAYLAGDKTTAADDLATAADEIRARVVLAAADRRGSGREN